MLSDMLLQTKKVDGKREGAEPHWRRQSRFHAFSETSLNILSA